MLQISIFHRVEEEMCYLMEVYLYVVFNFSFT